MEACRRETVSFAEVLPWLVMRFQTRSSSIRKRHSSVLPEAIFIICAGVSDWIMFAVSSEMPRRNSACSRSERMRLCASIMYDRLASRISARIWLVSMVLFLVSW